MPEVMSFGKEKWIVKYCPECRQWIKATPAYFPVEDLKLAPVCRACVANQEVAQPHMRAELTKS